jgi:hypothetical protein
MLQSGSYTFFLHSCAFALMAALSIVALNIINNNYPDIPVAGKQKILFNWLFLINFLLLSFLFGLVFAEYKVLKSAAILLNRSISTLPSGFYLFFIIYTTMLVFQFLILYGLYELRLLLYMNWRKKKFEFEEE